MYTGKSAWSERLRRAETLVPLVAVALVSITAVAAALMSNRTSATDPVIGQAQSTPNRHGVVQAPPLKAPHKVSAATSSMGAGPACRNCGVVEMVVAVHGYAQPQASSYQMHIRMDDGSVRTVEQRGALAAGSRVIVERESVRVLLSRV